jgi:hypothetical protein
MNPSFILQVFGISGDSARQRLETPFKETAATEVVAKKVRRVNGCMGITPSLIQ